MSGTRVPGQLGQPSRDNGTGQHPPFRGCPVPLSRPESVLDDWKTAIYRPDLVTSVNTLSYDFRTRTGYLTMPDLCCTDMGGCIRLFEAIDPEVIRIITVSGEAIDTVYTRGPRGWEASRA